MAKVLVVEDDPDIRGMVELRLRREGHRVLCAGSGEEALELLASRGAPEAVVLDVLMDGMSGLEVLSTMRQDPDLADVPAIFLSGRVQESDVEAGRALGATYLTKPVVLTALVRALDSALERTPAAAGTW